MLKKRPDRPLSAQARPWCANIAFRSAAVDPYALLMFQNGPRWPQTAKIVRSSLGSKMISFDLSENPGVDLDTKVIETIKF